MKRVCASFFLSICLGAIVAAQTTAFTYQGSLNNGGSPANGNYDFEFALFTSGGSLVIQTSQSNVPVVNGIFTVTLDFGATPAFTGQARLLEIRVRPVGGGSFTTLAPRTPINSSPFAIRSLTAMNALELNGIASSQYVLTTDSRMTDARSPTAGSTNYIQNQNAAPQALSNFNISGNGTVGGTLSANIVNSATQYNIGGSRVIKVDSAQSNTFVGIEAGELSVAGSNAFFGTRAGKANLNGAGNSYFGASAGSMNTNAIGNSFFGIASGSQTTSGSNSFFGASSGVTNVTGTHISLFGQSADSSDGLFNATAIGSRAQVTASNSLVLGSINGVNAASSDTNVGIGTTAPSARFHVVGASGAAATPVAIVESVGTQIPLSFRSGATEFARIRANNLGNLTLATTGGTDRNIFFRAGDDSNTDMFIDGGTGNVGIGTSTPLDKLDINGLLRVGTLGAAGATGLCRNASNQISTCSSSARYKSNIGSFSAGLDLILKLRPVSFNWREGGMLDLGLVAEEVAKVEPLLTTTNDKGQVEGVKYDRVGVVLVNAVKEQQAEIESLRKINAALDAQLQKQQAEIDALKNLICANNTSAEICRPRQ